MPKYDYACTACGHRFEATQSFSDAPLSECPECSGALRKVFTPVGVVFRGSGFYRTDSRPADPASKAAKTDPAPAASSGTGSESSSASGSSTDKGTDKGAGKGKETAAPAAQPSKESAA